MFRSCQIIIRELYYNIHNLIRFLQTRCCGSMSCCVGMCCRESSWLGVRRVLRNEGIVDNRSDSTKMHGVTIRFILNTDIS